MTILARFKMNRGVFHLDVDLDLPSTGVTSLFGPSGCGKTSLVRAIAGLDHHPGGFLKVDNSIWQDEQTFMPVHRRPLGYVFQESSLFGHLSVRGNLEYGLKRVPGKDRHISLDDAIELLEIGSLLTRRPYTLSGGERRRVAIARALAVSPKLLLLDEPLAGLDAQRKQEVIPYIDSLHRTLEIPIILVSHVPEEVARLSDHLVLMKDGQVTAAGDVHEMFTRLDLQLAREDDAAAIIEAIVVSHDEHFQLTHMDFAGGRITMPRMPFLPGQTARLRLAARDISLTLEKQKETSILNIIPVTVDALSAHGEAQVTVRLLAGEVPLLATITRKSAEDLGLASGKAVFAQIKSVALLT